MKTLLFVFIAVMLLALSSQAGEPAGRWAGAIRLPGNGELPIQIDLHTADGKWSGTIGIPLQGLKDYPLSGIAADGDSIAFAMAGIPGNPTFDGKMDAAGEAIAGSFKQGPQELTFQLQRTNEALTLKRPQEPKPPFPYQSKEVDFLVLLAPPAVALDGLLRRQSKDIMAAQGLPPDLIERASRDRQKELDLIKDASLSGEVLRAKLRESANAKKSEFSVEELEKLGDRDAVVDQNIKMSSTPWFRSLLREDPAVYLKTLKIPGLALFGENDVQVAAQENADALRAALAEAGNADFEVTILPGLNHLFQHSKTGSLVEYGTIEETFAPEALKAVGDWIVERFGR